MRKVLTMEDLRSRASSAFAQSGAGFVSNRYGHIATAQVVEGLMKNGFMPTEAKQQNTRTENRIGYQKHLIRFSHESYLNNEVGEYHPEIVLVNSHDRSSAYHLYFGIYRLVCSNGLIVCSADLGGLTVRHNAKVVGNVIEASYKLLDNAIEVQAQIEHMKSIELKSDKLMSFAREATIAKWGEGKEIEPESLIVPRRTSDYGRDVWTVYNTIQENLMKGGLNYQVRTENGKIRNATTRAISGVNETVKLNQKLWALAEKYSEVA